MCTFLEVKLVGTGLVVVVVVVVRSLYCIMWMKVWKL